MSEIRPCETYLQRRERRRALRSAAPSPVPLARRTAPPTSSASPPTSTKNTTTLSTKAAKTPTDPEQAVGDERGEERLAGLEERDGDENRVDEPLRVSDESQQRRRRLRFVARRQRLCAFTLEIRLSDVSATARKTRTTRISDDRDRHHHDRRWRTRRRSSTTAPVAGDEQLTFVGLHRRRLVVGVRGPSRAREGCRGRRAAPVRRRACRRARVPARQRPPGTRRRRRAAAARRGSNGVPRRAASSGNESTSVGPGSPMCSAFNDGHLVTPDERQRELAVLAARRVSTRVASVRHRSGSTSTSSCSLAHTTTTSWWCRWDCRRRSWARASPSARS